uniref:LPS export ABC transporter ATP-binding protein n=1 Tax=candidate division WOR-3 bacterium TaxID=2052148 RepID=A0A7C6E9S9_UNCW3
MTRIGFAKLTVEGLVKTYGGRKVVDNISLELNQSEIVGLLGPNGAGKTTTFSMIIGFILPDKGRILLKDQDITSLPIYQRARLGLGYLSQEASVFRKLRVWENIACVLELIGLPKSEIKARTSELLQKLNITHLANQRANTLSGGERRRVELARALATQPTFLLLDEPFTGIDPIVRAEIQDIINHLKQEGLGIMITDHNVRETLEITDRAYLMYDAKIVVFGTSEDLVKNPLARQVYLGERFRI